jgi:membrane-associated phospholipid phosphatase
VWIAVADTVISRTRPFTPQASQRAFAYVALAQHAAATAAGSAHGRQRPSVRAAVASASAVVLASLFPQQSTYVEDLLHTESTGPFAEPGSSFAAGETVGRAIGAEAIALAQTDNFSAPWNGTVPTGPGIWFSSATPPAPPVLPLLGQMRPFVMTSGSEFRPSPPPDITSPQFQTDLAEVRHIADTRTAEQDSIAKFWAMNSGSFPPGFWNAQASQLIVRRHMRERDAARTLAVMNAAGMDALIGSHEAKFTYWLLRPSQADPAIRLAIPLPNFPSYPSNHAALSSAEATVLARVFPEERDRLVEMADDAAISRIYGGIHYRFDATAGLELGRRIAGRALEAERAGRLLTAFR